MRIGQCDAVVPLHQCPHLLANCQVLLADLVHLLAVRPDFVVSSTETGCTARGSVLLLVRFAVTVQAHDGGKGTPLEPPNEQFVKGRIRDVGPVETPNVVRKPGDACDAHAQPGGDLIAEGAPG